MKSNKNSLITFVILCLTLIERAYACGHCNTLYIWHKHPLFLGIFLISVCYGIVIYFIYGLTRLVPLTKIVLSFLGFLLVSYLFYFGATECMVGPVLFIPGTIFCFVMPSWRLYKKALLRNEISKNAIHTARNMSLILLPVFLILSFSISITWQKRTTKYFDEHLIEMLNMRSVSVSWASMDKLIAIEDANERSKYISDLRELLNSGTSFGTEGALKVLVQWKNTGSVSAILQAWRKNKLYNYLAIEALKDLTKENFSNLEEWENWQRSRNLQLNK